MTHNGHTMAQLEMSVHPPPFGKFAAAQLESDLHVIGEDVVEVLHSSIKWVPASVSM